MKLEEIRATLEELKARIAQIESQIAEYEPVAEEVPEQVLEDVSSDFPETGPIDISIDELEVEPVRFGPEPVVMENDEPLAAKSLEEAILETGPAERPEPAFSINDKAGKKAGKAVVDVMGDRFPWRSGVIGTRVKNVISAISLNDRVLFINALFGGDPMKFQETISAFNAMESLDEAERYVFEKFPEWNLKSDTVCRLMMAVRRRLD